jgi:serine/threonine protein kinase
LAGYNPFDDPGSSEEGPSVFDQVRIGEFTFPVDEWSSITSEAKDLVRKLMTVDPAQRYTCEQALQHPWILAEVADAKRDADQANAEDEAPTKRSRTD